MNETLDVIHSRRSIRKYQPKQIADAELECLLEAARYAPSARTQQKWHFTVVQDGILLDRMVELIKEAMKGSGNELLAQRASDPGYHTFYHAPTVIIISGEASAGSIQIDCGAAAENIALAAESLNIGSCLLTSSRWAFVSEQGQALEKELGFPEGFTHICAVALGYKTEANPTAPARDPYIVTYVR